MRENPARSDHSRCSTVDSSGTTSMTHIRIHRFIAVARAGPTCHGNEEVDNLGQSSHIIRMLKPWEVTELCRHCHHREKNTTDVLSRCIWMGERVADS